MKQPDREEFFRDIIKEVNGHFEKKYWTLIPKEEVPGGEPILY